MGFYLKFFCKVCFGFNFWCFCFLVLVFAYVEFSMLVLPSIRLVCPVLYYWTL